MNKIAYSPVSNSGRVEVQLEGKNVGYIQRESAENAVVAWVYRYWPNGCKSKSNAGSAFTTLNGCKKSLEDE